MGENSEVYLRRARARYEALRSRAEHLPPQTQDFADAALQELSLAITFLQSESAPRTKADTAAAIATRGEMMSEVIQEAAFFRAVVEDLPTGLAVVGADGRVLYVNPAGLESLGAARGAMAERSAFDFIHPDDVERARNGFEQLLSEPGRVASSDLRVRHRDGGWLQVKLFGTGAEDSSPLRGLIITSAPAPERTVEQPSVV